MDAPSTYFGRALPSDAPLGAVPPALRPRVPKAIAKEAREVAAAIGVPANGTYAATLDALVAWFRGFTPGEPPPSKTSVYRDIALGKTGVCRHRGHGFVITAQALGIPARYVFNEAHVFVEVWVPAGAGVDAGWLRIDLGGGAEELDVHGGQGKSLHEGGPDPFSAPAPFETQREQGQTAGAERVNGLPAPEAPLPTPAAPTPGAPGAPGEGPGTSVARVVPMPELVQTTTTLTATGSIVYRGDGLDVPGRVTTLAGEPVVEGSVQLVLLVGPERRAVAQLGSTLALDKDGRFRASVAIPATQAPGSYDLVAEFLGNGVQSPSVSN
ncbi:MAG: transglutaminase-like domain-containing protein [Myxococcota bacterium]